MQYPKHSLYKYFENDISLSINNYIEKFVVTNEQLMDTKPKSRFLSPPFDFSKICQDENEFKDYTSVLKAYEQFNKLKTFRIHCVFGDISNTDSVSLAFVPLPISHVVLEPSCVPNVSKLKVESEGYRDHLLKSQIADVSYCVGDKFKGYIRGIYFLGKSFSNKKLEKLLDKSKSKNSRPIFLDLLKQFNVILDDSEISMIKEVQDSPEVLKTFLKEWDARLLDAVGSEKIQAFLSTADLTLKTWLTK